MAEKFLFDTSFEREGGEANRQAKAQPTFGQEDLDRARAEGFAAGREAGAAEARQATEQQATDTLAAIGQRLGALSADLEAAEQRHSQAAIATAALILRRLFPRLAEQHGLAEIEAIVSDCLERLSDEPRLVVRVADPILDAVEQKVAALVARSGFEGKIVFLAEEQLAPGDVRVEWADGGAERNGAEIWRRIDTVLERAIGPRPQSPPEETPSHAAPPADTGAADAEDPAPPAAAMSA